MPCTERSLAEFGLEGRHSRMIKEESFVSEDESEEETDNGESSEAETEDEDEEPNCMQATRAPLLPPAQFRSGRTMLKGSQLSLDLGWETSKQKANVDIKSLVKGLRHDEKTGMPGLMRTPSLNEYSLPPLPKSLCSTQLPPLPQANRERARRLQSISRSTPNLLSMTRLPAGAGSPPLDEIQEVKGDDQDKAEPDFDAEWVHALAKNKACSSSSLASLFKIATASPEEEEEAFSEANVGAGEADLHECRSFCATKRTFLQLHPRCLCGDRKKSDAHVKMHHCRSCGQRFNAIANASDAPPACVVHSGQVRKLGSGRYAWTCCMDKPRDAGSVQQFLLLNVPHLSHHI